MKYYLGIDPSTVSTGYAVLNENGELVEYGLIKPDKELSDEQKLAVQYKAINGITDFYFHIAAIGCEEQFNGPSVKTLKQIARTASMTMLVAAQKNIALYTFYPAQWRLIFHGKGNVVKRDTIQLVNEVHDLSLKGKDNDIADAIGIAHACLRNCLGGCAPPKK